MDLQSLKKVTDLKNQVIKKGGCRVRQTRPRERPRSERGVVRKQCERKEEFVR